MELNTIINGDSLQVLKNLESNSIDCCVTSPPYWQLRDYGVDGQLGLEESPEEYIEKMVEVFREVKRVLKNEGTLWVNIGDSYSTGSRNDEGFNERWHGKHYLTDKQGETSRNRPKRTQLKSLKPKDLVGIPWMLAFALRADGWYLRQDIIWNKPNPMPESVTDRCTKAHEYIFLLSKSPKYYMSDEGLKEPVQSDKGNANTFRGGSYCNGETFDNSNGGQRKVKGNYKMPDGWDTAKGSHGAFHREGREKGRSARDSFKRENSKRAETTHREDRDESNWNIGMRNRRSVWTVATKPFKEAHFATFPPELIKPCILAGCPKEGVVLDPFMGSGTVAVVAKEQLRNYLGIELNPSYIKIAEKRLNFYPQLKMI